MARQFGRPYHRTQDMPSTNFSLFNCVRSNKLDYVRCIRLCNLADGLKWGKQRGRWRFLFIYFPKRITFIIDLIRIKLVTQPPNMAIIPSLSYFNCNNRFLSFMLKNRNNHALFIWTWKKIYTKINTNQKCTI